MGKVSITHAKGGALKKKVEKTDSNPAGTFCETPAWNPSE